MVFVLTWKIFLRFSLVLSSYRYVLLSFFLKYIQRIQFALLIFSHTLTCSRQWLDWIHHGNWHVNAAKRSGDFSFSFLFGGCWKVLSIAKSRRRKENIYTTRNRYCYGTIWNDVGTHHSPATRSAELSLVTSLFQAVVLKSKFFLAFWNSNSLTHEFTVMESWINRTPSRQSAKFWIEIA